MDYPMTRPIYKALQFAALMALPLTGRGQQIGSTPPDAKMLPGGSTGSGGGGIYSPSLYDGTANINIPIFSYGGYGVALSYNTKGVMLDEMASSAGLHWDIVAEGSIRRRVKGLTDELFIRLEPAGTNLQVSTTKFYSAFYGRLAASFQSGTELADPETFQDGESDDFDVSVGGLSFTFNIGKTRLIFTNPYKHVTVTLLSNGIPYQDAVQPDGSMPDPLSLQFRITDERGNQYLFVKGDYSSHSLGYSEIGRQEALVLDGTVGDPYYAIDRWVVQEIILADGGRIRYDYRAVPSFGQNGGPAAYRSYLGNDWVNNAAAGREVSGSDASCLITGISYPGDTRVTFVYDTLHPRCDWGNTAGYGNQGWPLQAIEVGAGGNCLRYKLYQHYAVGTGSNTFSDISVTGPCASLVGGPYDNFVKHRGHRLILDSLGLESCDGGTEEPYYNFTYHTTRLPWRFRGGRDWYGYYNGKVPLGTDADVNIPLHTPNPGSTTLSPRGVDRAPDINYMQAAILTGVKNAYGGTVTFAYEAHSGLTNVYGALPTDAFFMGGTADDGLRLRSVTEADPFHTGSSRITTFTYSGGQRFLPGGYFHAPRSNGDLGNNTRNILFSGNFLTAHQLVGNANHGYGTVTVTVTNTGGQLLSKSTTTFTNMLDATVGQARYCIVGGGKPYFAFPYTDKQYFRDWELGRPLTVTDYDVNGNISQVTTNTYESKTDSTSATTKGVLNTKTAFIEDTAQATIFFPAGPNNPGVTLYPTIGITDPYRPYSGRMLLASTVTKKYLSNTAFIMDTVRYTYDPLYYNLKTVATRNSKGEEVQTVNYYNYELSPVLYEGLEQVMSSQRWRRTATGAIDAGSGLLQDAYFNGLTVTGTAYPYTKIWDKGQYRLRTGSPLSYAQYQGTGSYTTTATKIQGVQAGAVLPNFQATSQVLLTDLKGNPLETQLQGEALYKAMVWDTVTGRKLAEAGNCRYNDIAYSSFEGPDTYNRNLSVTASPQALISYSSSGISGRKSLSLWTTAIPGTAVSVTGSRLLVAGREYILSFWATGLPPNVFIGSTTLALPASAFTNGTWKNYVMRFTPTVAAAFKLTGAAASSSLDELRLYPSSATMQSWTYEPLFGQSSVTAASGQISYTEYDKLGRPAVARDQEGKIISKTQVTVQGAE